MPGQEQIETEGAVGVLLMMPAIPTGHAVKAGQELVAAVVEDSLLLTVSVAHLRQILGRQVVHRLADTNLVGQLGSARRNDNVDGSLLDNTPESSWPPPA